MTTIDLAPIVNAYLVTDVKPQTPEGHTPAQIGNEYFLFDKEFCGGYAVKTGDYLVEEEGGKRYFMDGSIYAQHYAELAATAKAEAEPEPVVDAEPTVVYAPDGSRSTEEAVAEQNVEAAQSDGLTDAGAPAAPSAEVEPEQAKAEVEPEPIEEAAPAEAAGRKSRKN